jgi:hypothetical protein
LSEDHGEVGQVEVRSYDRVDLGGLFVDPNC